MPFFCRLKSNPHYASVTAGGGTYVNLLVLLYSELLMFLEGTLGNYLINYIEFFS